MPNENAVTPPAVGEVWEGQGGTYGGIMPGRNGAPAYHIIFAEEIGQFTWGPYDQNAPEASLVDGLLNTQALIAEAGMYPAAEAAAAYEAEGHADFYLPAAAELSEVCLNVGNLPWTWVWSSTQRSSFLAFTMGVESGTQGLNDKDGLLAVRPFRRIPI